MTEQAPHPITLEKLFFTRSMVISVPGYTPNENAVSPVPTNHINVSKMEGTPGSYTVSMRTLLNPDMDKSTSYSIDMECLSILKADETLSEEEALRGVTITGHSVLFGAIREAVAWITGRQPYGPLMLGLSVLRSKPPPPAETP